VFDVEVVPGAKYDVQAIGVGCNLGTEDYYSDPLTITTSKWGDVVGPWNGQFWPAPDGSVGFTSDVIAVLDKFSNKSTAPIKARCDIDPDSPEQKVSITGDVSRVMDAFRGWAYPFGGPQEECPSPPPVGGCEADIRVDSNNDGVIDYFDDVIEETQCVTVIFNADDDNENGIPDWEEADVEGEDDLIEMQLSAPECAPGMWTGWSLSWDVTAPLEVWWYPNKYCPDCGPGNEHEPVHNLNEYPTAVKSSTGLRAYARVRAAVEDAERLR